jgi:hypothetical protein
MNQIRNELETKSIPTGSIDLVAILWETARWNNNTNQICEQLETKIPYWIDRSGGNTFGSKRWNNMNQICERLETKSIPTGSIDLVAILLGNARCNNNMNQICERLKPKYSYWIDRSGSNTLVNEVTNNMNQTERA